MPRAGPVPVHGGSAPRVHQLGEVELPAVSVRGGAARDHAQEQPERGSF